MASVPPVAPALDESWASLDVSDFSHEDDDTQSVNTDSGSLVDLSSIQDTESAVGDDAQSEKDDDEENVREMLREGLSRYSEQVGQPGEQDSPPYESVEDAIVFQLSEKQTDPDAITMQYVRSKTQKPGQALLKETITMRVSSEDLISYNRPFRLSYYGSVEPSRIKDDLLGKIGAALVTHSPSSSSLTSANSTFNVVPTEFGPGLQPSFADLIPTDGQVTISELSNFDNPPDLPGIISFSINQGTRMHSVPTTAPTQRSVKVFRPDLLVARLSHDDVKHGFREFNQVLQLSARHHWPTIVVADDMTIAAAVPRALSHSCGIRVHTYDNDQPKNLGNSCPVDFNTFMAIDIVQLSRHIMHLTTSHECSCETILARTSVQKIGWVNKILGLVGQPSPVQYMVNETQPSAENPPSSSNVRSWIDTIVSGYQSFGDRIPLKDLVFSFIVTMLGLYIVTTSQGFSSKLDVLARNNNSIMVSTGIEHTATVTATSAIMTSTITVSTADHQGIVSNNQVDLEHVWQLFTGRRTISQEVEQSKEQPAERKHQVSFGSVKHPSNDASSSSQVDTLHEAGHEQSAPKADGHVKILGQWLKHRLDILKTKFREAQAIRSVMSLDKLQKRDEIKDLHKKLQDFYQDAAVKLPKTSSTYQNQFHELIVRSQQHIRRSRYASEKKLDELAAQQKSLLAQAQQQARNIVSAKKKRKSFFTRG